MDWVFLIVSVNGAAYTVNAFRPVAMNRRFSSIWSFAASAVTIEFAWIHLVWEIVATAFFVRMGALKSKKGKAALGLNLASWVGLAILAYRSLGVRHEIRKAFGEFEPAPQEKHNLGVRKIRNIPYARAGGTTLRLDVYQPAEPAPSGVKRPAIIQIHGGAWVMGDKREQGLPLLRHLARQGWVGFNVNYRLSPMATFPDHLVDVKRALAWIREHADDYGIDPDFIAVTGGSAGGHLTAMMALTVDDKTYQPGFEDADLSVQAAVPFYGVYDFTNQNGSYPLTAVKALERYVMKAYIADEPEKFAAASPIDRIHADAPPFFVIHGDLDTLAPISVARDFVAQLKETSKAPVVYLELEGTQHAFEILPSVRAIQVIRATGRFLDAVHDQYLQGVAPEETTDEELADATGLPDADAESPADVEATSATS